MSIRERTEQNEKTMLSKNACLSINSKGRVRAEPECDIRTCFQKDRDRITHSASFRRLKHKTQVFVAPEGDHYRTRLTHTLEVSQIARTIARSLMLNEDLTEAIALGHDLGHTPFGHAGERVLDECLEGGFRHYEQSVRVCELLEKGGRGLNLTREVIDGILNHTNGVAKTLEGRVVRFSDKIAYINHDIDDAVKGGILTEDDIPAPLRQGLGSSKSERINTLVISIIENSGDDIALSDAHMALFIQLRDFMFETVYTNPTAKGEETKVESMIKTLFEHFCKNPDLLPKEYKQLAEHSGKTRAVADYIAGMTDRYSVFIYNELFLPKSWMVF